MNNPTLQNGWFGTLPKDIQTQIEDIGVIQSVSEGGTVYTIGATQNGFYGVVRGCVRIGIATNEHEPRFGHIIGPGGWFGEYATIQETTRLIEVYAASDCALLRIPSSEFNRLAEANPALWKLIAGLMATNMLTLFCAADDLMLREPPKRVAALLLRLSQRRSAHPLVVPMDEIPVTQKEIAEAANLSLSATGRILRDFEKSGWVTKRYSGLQIADAAALQHILMSD